MIQLVFSDLSNEAMVFVIRYIFTNHGNTHPLKYKLKILF